MFRPKSQRHLTVYAAGHRTDPESYYWGVFTPSPDKEACGDLDAALAEGYEPTKEASWTAAENAVLDLGIRAIRGGVSDAKFFHYHHRGGKEARKVKPPPNMDGPPSLTTFQGSPCLYRHYHYQAEFDREEFDIWKEHLVVRVTPKFVFVFMGEWASLCRLDRDKLERDGVAQGGGKHVWDWFYTSSGRDTYIAAAEARKQKEREERARRTEELRQALVGKTCVFCGTEPETFTADQYPTCRPCYRQNNGHYRLAPGHTIINVLGG
jgi:hypothetical protein